MKKIILLAISIFSIHSATYSQSILDRSNSTFVKSNATISSQKQVPLAGIAGINNDENWGIVYRNIEENEIRDEKVEYIKNSYPSKKLFQSDLKTEETDAVDIEIGQQYDTNTFDGSYPPDNAMAISNIGYVVTIVNSNYKVYNSSGQLKKSQTIEAFVNDASLNDVIFDPKILYDSGSDRFFFCELHGSSSTTSQLLLFFSKTNNPIDGWWYYKIAISSDVASRWADYPNIGVSNNEVYVTANLFTNAGQFKQSVIYQIDKNSVYNGGTLNYLFYQNITDDQGDPPFTIMPASFGKDGNYGPGILFVSVEDGAGSNKLQLFDITNDIGNSPTLTTGHVSVTSFQIGGNAVQPGASSSDLDIGDCRMKSAFFLNNIVHCAFTSRINTAGWNGINYSRITLNPLTVVNNKFGASGKDIAYPSIVPFTSDNSDQTTLLFYEESSGTIFPSMRVVTCDNTMSYSSVVTIKDGLGSIEVESDQTTYERWGDYSGICWSSGNLTPTVWVFGCYGKSNSFYGNNVCEIRNGPATGIEVKKTENSFEVYPNPVGNNFFISINNKKEIDASFDIYDISGKLVKHLASKSMNEGEYIFGFNKGMLTPGIYNLIVTSKSKIISSEKIIIQ
jgi:hypothetical protein